MRLLPRYQRLADGERAFRAGTAGEALSHVRDCLRRNGGPSGPADRAAGC